MLKIDKEKCKFEGPFECSHCNGHVMLDTIYLDILNGDIKCPYCSSECYVPALPGNK